MTTNQPSPQEIRPLPDGTSRPLWSVMIPTYNCASYLAETLSSVLTQDPGAEQMQIEVIDDCSTDDPRAVVDQIAPGRVTFHRQQRNVGHIRNFNTCIERARGRLVHILHGDDTVRDGFYRTMAPPFHDHPEIGAAFCRHVYVDASGREVAVGRIHQPASGIFRDAAYRFIADVGVQPPAVVVRRPTYETLGGFDSRMGLALEDLEMWVRIAVSYPVWHETAPLAVYHQRQGSIVSTSVRSGAVIRDFRETIGSIVEHLDADRRPTAHRAAMRRCANWAVTQARDAAAVGDFRTMLVQLREAARSELSLPVLVRALRTFARIPLDRRRRGSSGG